VRGDSKLSPSLLNFVRTGHGLRPVCWQTIEYPTFFSRDRQVKEEQEWARGWIERKCQLCWIREIQKERVILPVMERTGVLIVRRKNGRLTEETGSVSWFGIYPFLSLLCVFVNERMTPRYPNRQYTHLPILIIVEVNCHLPHWYTLFHSLMELVLPHYCITKWISDHKETGGKRKQKNNVSARQSKR